MLRINYGKSCGRKGAKRLGKGGHKLASRNASSAGAEIGTLFFQVLVGRDHKRNTYILDTHSDSYIHL